MAGGGRREGGVNISLPHTHSVYLDSSFFLGSIVHRPGYNTPATVEVNEVTSQHGSCSR